ncbi:MAG: hypothetical protein HC938_08420 [Nitrospira sp.]|nr:hypothetical protein [Nitrospira sp.]
MAILKCADTTELQVHRAKPLRLQIFIENPQALRACLVWLFMLTFALSSHGFSQVSAAQPAKVALDFNDVDIPVFVRFISELTGKKLCLG